MWAIVDYQDLAGYFLRLEEISKRLELTGILVEMFDELKPNEFEPVAYLLQGKVAPDWEGIELGLAEKLILKALVRAGGLDAKNPDAVKGVQATYHNLGDLGLAAEHLLGQASKSKQTGLMAFGDEAEAAQHSIGEVFETLRQIANVAGKDSQSTKQSMLEKLLADSSPLAARYIVRAVAGRARLGVADMTFLDALAAWHLGRGVQSVTTMEADDRTEHERVRAHLESAYDVTSDLSRIASILATEGLDAIGQLNVAMGVPLRPMAAERLKTLGEILTKHDGRSALETKYDGLRLQCHIPANGPVRIFSRRLEELTDQFPDVQAHLRKAVSADDVIVEGEVIAMDFETGVMRPFQDISRRRGRKTGLGEDTRQESALSSGAAASTNMMDEIPVAVFLFDCLAIDGNSIMDQTYADRRAALSDAFEFNERVRLAAMEICEDEGAMESTFLRAVDEGGEGIMCKSLDGIYKAGNRGFDWIKYKTDYTEDLVDTMDLVVVGAFNGRGRRAGWYGALLMACRDPSTGKFSSVCKLGTGFDDETLKTLKDRFAPDVSQEKPPEVDSEMTPDVWIRPTTVMEVQAAEITLSPIHRTAWGQHRADSGLAARFPRFTNRWRDDKSPDQATTVEEMVAMYEAQAR